MSKRVGKQTVKLNHPVSILSSAAIVGQKEKDGPLGTSFDVIMADAEWNEEHGKRLKARCNGRRFGLQSKRQD